MCKHEFPGLRRRFLQFVLNIVLQSSNTPTHSFLQYHGKKLTDRKIHTLHTIEAIVKRVVYEESIWPSTMGS